MPWYVKSEAGSFGPYDDTQIRAIAKKGRIDQETRVSQSREGPWVAASHVKGLFAGVTLIQSTSPTNGLGDEGEIKHEAAIAGATESQSEDQAKQIESLENVQMSILLFLIFGGVCVVALCIGALVLEGDARTYCFVLAINGIVVQVLTWALFRCLFAIHGMLLNIATLLKQKRD